MKLRFLSKGYTDTRMSSELLEYNTIKFYEGVYYWSKKFERYQYNFTRCNWEIKSLLKNKICLHRGRMSMVLNTFVNEQTSFQCL